MLTIKSSAHLLTNRHRRSFRACRGSTGVPAMRAEAGRHLQERIGLTNRVSRRIWLDALWTAHFQRVASRTEAGGHSTSEKTRARGRQ